MFIGCSSVFLIGTTQEHPGTTQESNETQDKWGCSGYFTPDTGTRERENTRREHRNTTRRMTSAWCNLVVPCWKLIGCIRDSPLASKHSVFLPGTLQTASFLLVPGTLRRTPLYLEARVFTPSFRTHANRRSRATRYSNQTALSPADPPCFPPPQVPPPPHSLPPALSPTPAPLARVQQAQTARARVLAHAAPAAALACAPGTTRVPGNFVHSLAPRRRRGGASVGVFCVVLCASRPAQGMCRI